MGRVDDVGGGGDSILEVECGTLLFDVRLGVEPEVLARVGESGCAEDVGLELHKGSLSAVGEEGRRKDESLDEDL